MWLNYSSNAENSSYNNHEVSHSLCTYQFTDHETWLYCQSKSCMQQLCSWSSVNRQFCFNPTTFAKTFDVFVTPSVMLLIIPL